MLLVAADAVHEVVQVADGELPAERPGGLVVAVDGISTPTTKAGTTGTRTVFHNEGGTASRPKVYKVQIRPDPLAH